MRSSVAIGVLVAGAIALALVAGLRAPASAQVTPTSPAPGPKVRVFPEEPEPLPSRPPAPPDPTTARPTPEPPRPVAGSRPTREQLVDAQRRVGERFAEAIQLEADLRPRFLDDYMLYATAVIDTDASIPTDTLRKVVEQRCTEFEARVATYLSAEQYAALRAKMNRR
jgi:hypothetical protein